MWEGYPIGAVTPHRLSYIEISLLKTHTGFTGRGDSLTGAVPFNVAPDGHRFDHALQNRFIFCCPMQRRVFVLGSLS